MKLPCLLLCGTVLSALAFSPASASPAPKDTSPAQNPILTDRAAAGDLALPGGARRLRGDQTAAIKASLSDKPAKNVILLIGDGMGDSEITAARNYAYGAGGFFPGLDALPMTGQYTHYDLDKKTHKPNYVTDSAASASTWATGTKTYYAAVSVDVNDKPMPTLLELAKKAGYATGNITTAALWDATPAAEVAHTTSRYCRGPVSTSEKCPSNALENGGHGSILEQMLLARPDVSMGGGAKIFSEDAKAGKYKGESLKQQALALGYNWAATAQDMEKTQIANRQKPLLAVFADKDLPTAWDGPFATYHGNLSIVSKDGEAVPPKMVKCVLNPDHTAATPSLAAMTEKAIELLSANKKGFFLQAEGASIDKSDHDFNPCRQIGETVEFDKAVQKALDFARKDGNTLVIVTADHAQASQLIGNDNVAPGLTQTLITADGAPMTMSYATSEGSWQKHTGTQVRIAAYGPQAANVLGLTDQEDLFYTISHALDLKQE